MTKNEITLVTKENVLSSNADANINVGYDAAISFCKKLLFYPFDFSLEILLLVKQEELLLRTQKILTT
jgi:hypothetical protein